MILASFKLLIHLLKEIFLSKFQSSFSWDLCYLNYLGATINGIKLWREALHLKPDKEKWCIKCKLI